MKKFFSLMLILLLSVSTVLLLASCGEDEDTEEHTFETHKSEPGKYESDMGEWHLAKEASCTEAGAEKRDCAFCSYSEKRKTDTAEHTYLHWDIVTPPSCLVLGKKESRCEKCGNLGEESIPKTDHREVTDAAVSPNCTDFGLTEGKHCEICNTVILAQEPVDPKGHTEITHPEKTPTCTDYGYESYVSCADCDYTTYRETAATGHDWISDNELPPTCTETGLTSGAHCSKCTESYGQELIPAKGHSEVSHKAQDPTCSNVGWAAYVTCYECDYSTYSEIPANGHSYAANDICTVCSHEKGSTEGLEFLATNGGSTYIVLGKGTAKDTDIVIPSTYKNIPVIRIGENAFINSSDITSVTIPESITSIGDGAFAGCEALTTVNFNAAAMEDVFLGFYGIFGGSGVTSEGITINIGTKVTKIPAYFTAKGNSNTAEDARIVKINFADNGVCASIGKNAFIGCLGLTEISIPDTVYTIGEYAFCGCYSLEKIKLPSNIITISQNSFASCCSLREIKIPESVMTIERGAFSGCSSLSRVTVPASVTSVGESAFSDCLGLLSVTLLGEQITIDYNAFDGCNKLVEIYNLSSLTLTKGDTENGSIAYNAKDIYTSNAESSKLTETGDGFVFYNDSGKYYLIGYYGDAASITLPESYEQADYELYPYVFSGWINLTDITIPSGFTHISNGAFFGCSGLVNIVMLDGVISIGDSAFSGCSELVNIVIPDGVISIGGSAFSGCTALANVTLPNSVETIGESSFWNCYNLREITLPKNLKAISNYLFAESGLRSLVVPEGVESIGHSVFYNCRAFSEITISSTVTSIGHTAFWNTELKSIVIPNGVTRIEVDTFTSCEELTTITIPGSVIFIHKDAFKLWTYRPVDIIFEGTEEEWLAIEKENGWNNNLGGYTFNVTYTKQ